MDWTSIITALISALLSGGGIAGFMNFKENKRSAQLKNETTASSQWRELYEKAELKVDNQVKKIEVLYKETNHLRDQLDARNTTIATLTLLKCKKLACMDRQPPFGSQITDKNDKSESE